MSEAAKAHDIVLTLEDVSKAYAGTLAVKHATFAVRRGAVNVLVGENGAGKSTLMKIIAGVEQPTLGRIVLDGKTVHFPSTADAVAHGIGMVFQELNLFGNLSVAENIFATREITHGIRGIDHKAQQRQAAALMERLQTGIDPARHGRGPAHRPAAARRDRQGGRAERPHPDHGRADLRAQRDRGRGAVPRHR